MGGAQKTILVIDDDDDYLTLIKDSIEKNNFRCLTALTAWDGLELAIKHHPDLILLDLLLPKMSGLGFLQEVKRHPDLIDIPIVILSGIGDEEVAEESLERGAVDYLTKESGEEAIVHCMMQYTDKSIHPLPQ